MVSNYVLVNKSESGHCCFRATILKLNKSSFIDEDGDWINAENICECFSVDQAKKILDLLEREQ